MKSKYDIYLVEHADIQRKTNNPNDTECQDMFSLIIPIFAITGIVFILIIVAYALMPIGIKAVHKKIAPYQDISEWHKQGKYYAEKKRLYYDD